MDLIEQLVGNHGEINEILLQQGQLSLQTSIVSHYRKILLLSCASYYESKIQEIVLTFAREKSGDERIFFFLKNKAISRQYHTYFNWDSSNV